jgi:hypothetical protein
MITSHEIVRIGQQVRNSRVDGINPTSEEDHVHIDALASIEFRDVPGGLVGYMSADTAGPEFAPEIASILTQAHQECGVDGRIEKITEVTYQYLWAQPDSVIQDALDHMPAFNG